MFGILKNFIVFNIFTKVVVDVNINTDIIDINDFSIRIIALSIGRKNKQIKNGRQSSSLFR